MRDKPAPPLSKEGQMRKLTKDLTEAEILGFDTTDLTHWMQRVMARLYKLLDKATYENLAVNYVLTCRGGIDYAKRGLVQLVKVIQEKWTGPHLSTVQ